MLGKCIPYTSIKLSVTQLRGDNIIPLSIDKYRTELVRVFKHLEDVYGVKCGRFENVGFKELELNINIQLDNNLDSLKRISLSRTIL